MSMPRRSNEYHPSNLNSHSFSTLQSSSVRLHPQYSTNCYINQNVPISFNDNDHVYNNRVSNGFYRSSKNIEIDANTSNKSLSSMTSLSNLGNTCFLNSVLYTLKFTPGFCHNLHHFVQDLESQNENNNSTDPIHRLTRDFLRKLHDVFRSLNGVQNDSHCFQRKQESVPPSSFLESVCRLNPVFEGNQQQDAHELLVTILNSICDVNSCSVNGDSSDDCDNYLRHVEKSLENLVLKNDVTSNSIQQNVKSDHGSNFVRDNFVGKYVMQTQCLECESSTYCKENFCNIDIPLHVDSSETIITEDGNEFFLSQILMNETLRENNKYWCEECCRLNEAVRSVHYEYLPNVLIFQLKRFTSLYSKCYMSTKINDHVPTPFSLDCFCTTCQDRKVDSGCDFPDDQNHSLHSYRLFAVIMHLGSSIASGHYIAYVRNSVSTRNERSSVDMCDSRRSAKHNSKSSTYDGQNVTEVRHHVSGKKLKSKNPGATIMKFLRGSKSLKSDAHHSVSEPNSMVISSNDCVDGQTKLDEVNVGNKKSSLRLNSTLNDLNEISNEYDDKASSCSSSCSASECCSVTSDHSNCSTINHIISRGGGTRHHLNMERQQTLSRFRHCSDQNGTETGGGGECMFSFTQKSSHEHRLKSSDDIDCGGRRSRLSSDLTDETSFSSSSETWLECDDEHIQLVTRSQFEKILSAKNNTTTTPYLLLYQKHFKVDMDFDS